MHFSDKSLAYKKNGPSISYYSNYNNINSSFDLTSKPVNRYSKESCNMKASNLENKASSFTSSSMSSSSSSTSSAYQSDNNNFNNLNKVVKPKSISPKNFKYLNNKNHLQFENTENQIDRILNDLKNCSESCSNEENKKPLNNRFNVNNLNRLSSYDNHDTQEYLDNNNSNSLANNLNIIDEFTHQVNIQHTNNDSNNSLLLPTNVINVGIYGKKRASIAGQASSNIIDANKSKSKTSNSTTTINTDMYGSNSKVSNLFSRAFSLASKKNNSSMNSSQKETWKSKLGKYLPHHLSNSSQLMNSQKSKNSNDEGCDIMIDEDLYSSYHLTRRNPINRESIATLTLEKTKGNQINLKKENNNTNKKLSSISNSSVDLTTSQHSSSFSAQIKNKNEKSSRLNLDQENNNLNKTGQFKLNHSLKSESKPNLSNKENISTNQPFSANFTNSLNKLIINNGFNSLRKILKFPSHKSQNLNEIFDDSKNVNESNCYIPPVTHKSIIANKTLSSSSFNANNKSNLNTFKNSQISLTKSNEVAKNPIKLTDSSSSSSVSRSSSIVASGSSLSTPSSIIPNSKSNSNINVQADQGIQGQTNTLISQPNKSNLKKQHSFSSTTNAYHFSMFDSSRSESMKQNALQSKSTSVGLNRQHEHIKSLNNLPNGSFQSYSSNRRHSSNKTSKSTTRIDEVHKNTIKESKVKTMFKIYKNVLNKMSKVKSVSNNNTLTKQHTSNSNNKENFNCFNKNNSTKPGIAKSLLLNNELSCVKNECSFLGGNGGANASSSTLSGIGYFRRASLSSSSETNFELNLNENSPIKLYDGHRSLVKQLEMHKLTTTYDTDNNLILHHSEIGVNKNKNYENTSHLNPTVDIFSNQDPSSKTIKNNFIETKNKIFLDTNKLVKDSLLTVEEDMMCDREVASFFDVKSKQAAAKEMIYFDQSFQHEIKPSVNLTASNCYEQENDLLNDDSEFNESNEDFYEYNSFDDDSNHIDLNSQEDSQLEENDEEGEEEAENLEYLVKQLAVEASLSSVNLNGKLILNNKKELTPPQLFLQNNYTNNSKYSNYEMTQMNLEDLVDDLNKNFDKKFLNNKNKSPENEKESIDDDNFVNIDNNRNQQLFDLNEDTTANLTDTEIQSILRSSEVSSASFLDEMENNLKLINKHHNANELFSSLKKSQPSSLVKHVSSTIVRPIKHYDTQQASIENGDRMKKSFNSTILVQKPLIISPFENYTSSLGRGTAYKNQDGELIDENDHKELGIKNGSSKLQPLNDINFNNIKIEKKIRLNYRRPQNLNYNNTKNYLNFGTLC